MADATPTSVTEIAVNLDDTTGEVIGQATAALLDAGALDVWTTPIGMKGSRPGVCLSLLCPPEEQQRLAKFVLQLTGAFGCRFRPWDRLVLDRRHEMVDTPVGPMRIKVGRLDGKVVSAKPEFADAAALAAKLSRPARDVLAAGQAAAARWVEQQRGGDA